MSMLGAGVLVGLFIDAAGYVGKKTFDGGVNVANSVKCAAHGRDKIIRDLNSGDKTYKNLSSHYLSDPDIALLAFEINSDNVGFCKRNLFKNETFARAAIKVTPKALPFCQYEPFYRTKEFNIYAVQQPGTLKHIPEEFLLDRDVILAAVTADGTVLQEIRGNFRRDDDIIMAAIKSNGNAIQFAPDSYKNDQDISLLALQHGASPKSIKLGHINRKLIEASVQYDGNNLKSAPVEFHNDLGLAKLAVRTTPSVYYQLSQEFRNENDVIIEFYKTAHQLPEIPLAKNVDFALADALGYLGYTGTFFGDYVLPSRIKSAYK